MFTPCVTWTKNFFVWNWSQMFLLLHFSRIFSRALSIWGKIWREFYTKWYCTETGCVCTISSIWKPFSQIPSQRNDSILIFVHQGTWYEKVDGTAIFLWHLRAKLDFKYLAEAVRNTFVTGVSGERRNEYKRLQWRRSLGEENWARPKLLGFILQKWSCNHDRYYIWILWLCRTSSNFRACVLFLLLFLIFR